MTSTSETKRLISMDDNKDAIALANFANKFGKKPFGLKKTSNASFSDAEKPLIEKKPSIASEANGKSDGLEPNGNANGKIQNGSLLNGNKTTDLNGIASLFKNNVNKNNDNNNDTAQARDRFRRAGMKARLARRMERIAEDRMTVKQIFNRYVDNSTLHGFRYIFMDTYNIRRFLWFALLVAFASIFFNELKNSILLFYEYPFTTTSTVEYVPELKFPAISICNLNQFELTKVKKGKLKELYENGGLPFKGNQNIHLSRDVKGKELIKTLVEASQSIETLFRGCEWKSRDTAKKGQRNICSPQNFTVYNNLYGQKCFTFNSGEIAPILMLNETGLSMALTLEFDLHSREALPGLEEFGLKVIVHDQSETPLQQAGFVVPPGFQSFVELKARRTENLKPPYATSCGEKPLKHFDEYKQSKCFLEQLGDIVKGKCGCRGLFMPDTSLRFCTLNETVNCLLPAVQQYDRRTNIECPVDCETYQYITSLSYAKFLTNSWRNNSERIERVSSYIDKLRKSMPPKQFKDYIEDNVVVIQIFYQEMKEENVIQEPSYDFYKLVGDVGGQLGLMLGASVLTLVEFVDLFLFTVYHQLLRFSKKKTTT